MATARRRTTGRTAADDFFDALVRHQIGLLRSAGGIRRKVWELLDATEQDVRRAIVDRLSRPGGFDSPAQLRRLKRLLDEIEEVRTTAWRDVERIWREDLVELALAEPKLVDGLLRTAVPVTLTTTLPDATTLRALVTTRPLGGKLLRDWAREIRAADVRRIETQIRVGLTQGESGQQIARRVVGTVALRGRNGVLEVSRRDAEAITRTAVNAISNETRRLFFVANGSLFADEVFVATLDSATTPICRSLDGKRFPVGEGAIPPMHVRCRSTRVARLDAEVIGKRPYKPTTQQMLLREFAAAEGFQASGTRGGLPYGTKGRFDRFARQRTRELVGRTEAKVTYQQWLERQSAEFQDDVLGRARGALFRRGDLTVDQFVDRTGRELRLDELARFHRDAFRAAGLDPEDFLR